MSAAIAIPGSSFLVVSAIISALVVLGALGAAALALTRLAGPRNGAAFVAGYLIAFLAITAAFTEAVGRISFTRPAYVAAALALLAAGLATLYFLWGQARLPRRSLPSPGAIPAIVWPFAAAWILLLLYGAYAQIVTPASIGDALRYHFAAPVSWAAMDQIAYAPEADFRINHFPHVTGLLWGLPLVLIGSDILSGLFPLLCVFALWPAVTYFIARSFGADAAPAFILSVTASSAPLVLLQGMNHGADILFWAASLTAIFTALRQDQFRLNWIIFAAAAGLALGTKSFGVVTVAFAALIWFVQRIRLSDQTGRFAVVGSETLAAGAVILAIGGAVYLANLTGFGNPLYPYDFPVTFGAAPLPEQFYDKGVISTEASHWDAFLAIVKLAPHLLLSLPPLDRDFMANSGGFGILAPVLTLSFAAAAAVFHARTGFRDQPEAGRFYIFAAAILAANAILITQWGFQVAQEGADNYSSVGRYQVFWLALLAAGLALMVTRLPRARPGLYVLLGLCILYNAQIVTRGHAVSLDFIDRRLDAFPDRTAQGLQNEYMSAMVIQLLKQFPEANLLLINSGEHTYSFHFPSFERRVFVSPLNSPSKNILRPRSGDRRIYDAILGRAEIPEQCVGIVARAHHIAGRNPYRAANYALIDQTVFENRVRFIFEYRGAAFLGQDARFRLIHTTTHRRHPANVYEVREDAAPLWRRFADCLESGPDADLQ
ncbi:hypothetical protein [Euryhalocaulis caribicus]|uniref:hypothetical protein n=1 Tax=Euryhalocaulis caribicus TaxID=1161401 RepID=UPI0003A127F6|nr:hypothetical protein [Euryhalocaulis caribicus]